MEGGGSKETEDHFKGVIKMLEHDTETEWKGGAGKSEGSVGKVPFCCIWFRALERMSSKIMEWL